MAPNAEVTDLGQFGGTAAFAFITPLLAIECLALLLILISSKPLRFVLSSLGLIASLLVGVLALIGWSTSDSSGLKSEIERLTGIALTHGLELSISNLFSGFIFFIACLLAGLSFGLILVSQNSWARRNRRYETNTSTGFNKSKPTEPRDSIGLWDSQR